MVLRSHRTSSTKTNSSSSRRTVFPSSLFSAIRETVPARAFQSLSNRLFSVFFPDQCRLCERVLTRFTPVPICNTCLSSLDRYKARFYCRTCGQPFETEPPANSTRLCGVCLSSAPAFDQARSFGIYEGDLRRLIHLLKYDRMRPLAGLLARHMAAVLPELGDIDLIVPVPLYRWRRWKRGFNQSELLARELSRLAAVACRTNVLRRVKATRSQAGLSNRERRKNVAGVFAVRNPAAVRGRSVLVVDDVMTTGATLEACSKALKKAGATYVAALAIARAKRRIIEVSVSPPGKTEGLRKAG